MRFSLISEVFKYILQGQFIVSAKALGNHHHMSIIKYINSLNDFIERLSSYA